MPGVFSTAQSAAELKREPFSSGAGAKKLQEWLSLRGFGVSVDGDFGPATKRALRDFADAKGISGADENELWAELCLPMRDLLDWSPCKPPAVDTESLEEVALQVALRHAAASPRELGGKNLGPWVRLYMHGREGTDWPWCAGFATFVVAHAAHIVGCAPPLPHEVSSSALVARAKSAGLFLKGEQASKLPKRGAFLFVVRGGRTGWKHTGVGFSHCASDGTFYTVEGNTNDEGTSEGREVCTRTRSTSGKDFVLLEKP